MRIRNKWLECFLPSDHRHWCLHLDWPNQHDETPEFGVFRLRLVVGIWRFFLCLNLWRVEPTKYDSWSLASKSYGLTFFDRSLHVHHGKTTIWNLPWAWEMVRWDLLKPDAEVLHRNLRPMNFGVDNKSTQSWYELLEKDPEPALQEFVRYVHLEHTTRDGRVQQATIRLAGEEREWRWQWFTWLPWPRLIRRTVDCSSSCELGERAGEWKGGLTGWSCQWQEHESMEAAFYRWYENWNGR